MRSNFVLYTYVWFGSFVITLKIKAYINKAVDIEPKVGPILRHPIEPKVM